MGGSAMICNHESERIYRFYDIICLLRSLSLVRGSRIKQKSSVKQEGINIAKFRREFADALAYICAYDKTAESVTAIALGKREQKVTIWIAANDNVKPKVVKFLNEVLKMLDDIANTNVFCTSGHHPITDSSLEVKFCDVLGFILNFNQERNHKYYKSFLLYWSKICQSEEHTDAAPLKRLNEWIQEHFFITGEKLKKQDMVKLAQVCHGARRTDILEILKQYSGQDNKFSQEYEQLFKLFYKLGKHITFTMKLVEARIALREDFKYGFDVTIIPRSKQKPNLPQQPIRDLRRIAESIFPDADERSRFLHHVQKFFVMNDVSKTLSDQLQSPRRVHAEIKIVDYFDKDGVCFLDENQPYIGCSKPACYLCYHYIAAHPKNYFLPSSHQKLYPAWCLPLVGKNDRQASERRFMQKRFLEEVTQKLEADLRVEVKNQMGPRARHADSTIGASSTVSAHEAGLGATNNRQHLQVIHEILARRNYIPRGLCLVVSPLTKFTGEKRWYGHEGDNDEEGGVALC